MDTEWEAEGSHPQISLGVPDLVGKLGPQEDGRISSLAPMSLLPRSQLAVIPQEPFLFSGTVRENLDPQGLHEDRALWQALEQCHLSEVAMAIGESWVHREEQARNKNGRRQYRRSAYRRPGWGAGRKGQGLVPRAETAAVPGKGSSHRC